MKTGDGSLKPGWTRVAFGDVVRQVKDLVDPAVSGMKRYVAGEHMDTDDLRIGRWGEIGDGYLGPAFHMRFRPGQVLYGSRRTYLRKVAVADFDGVTANTTFVLESKAPDILLPDLLPFIMQAESFHKHSIEQSKGSVNPYVNFSDLAVYEFALPPLDEQRQLADLLRTSTEVRCTIDRLMRSAEKSRQSFIDSVTAATHGPAIRMEDLCDMQNGRPFPRSEYNNRGVRLLRPGNLDPRGYLAWSPSKTVCLPDR